MSSSIPVITTPPMSSESMRVVRKRSFFRQRRDLVSFLTDVCGFISSEKSTGRLIIDFNSGGFGAATLEESTDLPPLP